jgi:hypothetical protein
MRWKRTMGGSWKYALSSLKVDNSHLRSVSYKQETRRDIHVADGGANTDCYALLSFALTHLDHSHKYTQLLSLQFFPYNKHIGALTNVYEALLT